MSNHMSDDMIRINAYTVVDMIRVNTYYYFFAANSVVSIPISHNDFTDSTILRTRP